MRDEMNKNLAQTFALIIGALLVAGGLGAAVGLNVGGLEPDHSGILLLLDGAFGFLVFIGALGQFNSFKILELYVRNSAEEIREIAGADPAGVAPRGLLSFQSRVAAFNRNPFRFDDPGLALLVSYGTVPVVSGFALIVLGAIVALGWLTRTSHNLMSLAGLLMLLDVVLVAVTLGWLVLTFRNLERWESLFSARKETTADTPAGRAGGSRGRGAGRSAARRSRGKRRNSASVRRSHSVVPRSLRLHEAIIQVLEEAGEPLSAHDIAERIRVGGLYEPPRSGHELRGGQVSARVGNATYRDRFVRRDRRIWLADRALG